MTAWTQLEDSAIWKEAKAAYGRPEGRHYHDFAHVERLYEIAAETRLPYDLSLDLAILTHDVVYDDAPDKERRSASWLMDFAPAAPNAIWQSAVDLVLSTIDHHPGGDDRLALLDLHDFTDLDRSLQNRELLVQEFAALAGADRESFLTGNGAFLEKMAGRIEDDLYLARDEARPQWAQIAAGIRALLAHEPAEEAIPVPA